MADIINDPTIAPLELYIRIVEGRPFEHPMLGDNFRQAFPHIDTENLTADFARFERVECDVSPGPFERAQVRYEWVGDVVRDVWFIEPMTPEEKEALLIQEFLAPHPEGWVFDPNIPRWVSRLNLSKG